MPQLPLHVADARLSPRPPFHTPPAFDGSPVTCYCPLVEVPEGRAYSIGSRRSRDEPVSCEQPEGYAISGEYTT